MKKRQTQKRVARQLKKGSRQVTGDWFNGV